MSIFKREKKDKLAELRKVEMTPELYKHLSSRETDKKKVEAAGKKKVEIYELIRKTPNGRHGWYRTNIGLIKKPIQ